MLRVEDLKARYGRVEVLHGLDLDVRQGEIVALVGANGAGKTTLLRTISGVHAASGGRILFEEQDITRAASHLRVGLGIVQVPEGRQVFAPLTVEDNLRLGAWRRSGPAPEDDMAKVLELFPVLKDRRRQAAGALSGGQQQMLAVGRAMMASPRLLLLDEPSMGLAPLIAAQILDVIQRLARSGITVLLVEQNAQAALAIADRGYVMETGRIALTGPGRALLADENVRKAYLGL
ncbi:MAG: ABC transporter ATP-binding protein [Hyphomicrobiaceae bacterium]|nr:ABC transporter ATP-binding protein [Hyphomicrobiaceae bacterium]